MMVARSDLASPPPIALPGPGAMPAAADPSIRRDARQPNDPACERSAALDGATFVDRFFGSPPPGRRGDPVRVTVGSLAGDRRVHPRTEPFDAHGSGSGNTSVLVHGARAFRRLSIPIALGALAALGTSLPASAHGKAPTAEPVACLAADPGCEDPRPLDGAALTVREFAGRLLGERRGPVDFAAGGYRLTERYPPFDAYGSGAMDEAGVIPSLPTAHAPGTHQVSAATPTTSRTATFEVAETSGDRLLACLDRRCSDTVPLDGAVIEQSTFGIRWQGEVNESATFQIDDRPPRTERFAPYDGYGTEDMDGTTRLAAHTHGRHTARITTGNRTFGASFAVALPGSAIARLALRDTASARVVGGYDILGDGETLFVDELPGNVDPTRLAIEAVPTRPEIGYVEFRVDGTLVYTDRSSPYILPLAALGRERARTVEARPYGSDPGFAGTSERISLRVRDARPASCAGLTLRQLIDKTPIAGDGGSVRILVPPCLFRESLDLWSGEIELVADPADPGAEIRGSDLWAPEAFAYDAAAGGWVSDAAHTVPALPVKTFGPDASICADGSLRCVSPEQVFVDGRALARSGGSSDNGRFWIRSAADGSRRVVLRDDPAGARIEVTVRPYWIDVRNARATIRGFRMRHAGHGVSTGRAGLRGGRGSAGTLFENNILSDANVPLSPGEASVVRGNDVFRGGQQAIATQGNEIVIEGNRFRHSNVGGFDPYWEAGGMKFVRTDRMSFRRNEVAFNAGYGLWYDIDNYAATITENRIHHNERAGIHYEISGSLDRPSDRLPDRPNVENTVISGNTVWENGWTSPGWTSGGSGIFVASSHNVDVRDNTLAWNADGVSVVAQTLPGVACRFDDVRNVSIHGNRIVHTPFSFQRLDADGAPTFDEGFRDVLAMAFRNEGGCPSVMYGRDDVEAYDNTYWFDPRFPAEAPRYLWNEQKYVSLDAFGATSRDGAGLEGRSRVGLDPSDMLAERLVPIGPEPRPRRSALSPHYR